MNDRVDGSGIEIVRVTTTEAFRSSWYPLCQEIFPDAVDLEPLDVLLERFREMERNLFSLVRMANEFVGVLLLMRSPLIAEAIYTPYGGLIESYRGHGLYPKIVRLVRAQMVQQGAKYGLADVEDPTRVAIAFPDQPDAAIQNAVRRLDFFQRTGIYPYIIQDPMQPPSAYMRPASNRPEDVQAYDLLAIAPFEPDSEMWTRAFNPEKTAIRKEYYRRFYLEITQIQYGDKSEAMLRRDLPAVDRFLSGLDSCGEWIRLRDYQPAVR